MAVRDIQLLVEGWCEKCFHSVWTDVSKLSRDSYLEGVRADTIGYSLFFPISSSHTCTKLVMIMKKEVPNSFLFFDRFLFSRHSASILQLQFPPEEIVVVSDKTCEFMYRKMVTPKHMYLENAIQWPTELHLFYFFIGKQADHSIWLMWLLLK